MHLPEPVFPPILSEHSVKAPESPLACACRGAADGSLGAGDLVWARATDVADLALVLEPDVPENRARQMMPLAMVAVTECLGALMPPQTSVLLRVPDLVLVNGGEAGRVHYRAAPSDSDAPPEWLVIGARIEIHPPRGAPEPGETAHRTALALEGGGGIDRTQILERLAAHLLALINGWADEPFSIVADRFVGLVEGHEDEASLAVPGGGHVRGRVLGLSEEIGLIVQTSAGDMLELPLIGSAEKGALPATAREAVR